jgi:Arc/MetJ-type ribon-helix-helix transcriptional regulator
MSEKEAQINVKLAQSTLDDWDEYREERGFSTRAEFVRFAVNREIESENQSNQSTGEMDTEALGDIHDTLSTLSEEMQSMKGEMETLQNAVRSDPETEKLADNIFSLLPDCQPGSDEWEAEKMELEKEAQADIDGAKEQYKAWEATPEALAEATGKPLRKVHVALDKLIAETHLIRTEEEEEQTRYWKEV